MYACSSAVIRRPWHPQSDLHGTVVTGRPFSSYFPCADELAYLRGHQGHVYERQSPPRFKGGSLIDFVYYLMLNAWMRISNFLPVSSVSGKLQSDDRALASTAYESLVPQGMKHLLETPEVVLDFVAVLEVT